MNTFGQDCHVCRQRPAIRADGLCAGCGETHDVAIRFIEAYAEENPLYGPGNPDWERDFDKTGDAA